MAKSKPKKKEKEEEIKAQDCGTYRAKKDRAQLKRKGIVSPDLSKGERVPILRGFKIKKHGSRDIT